MSQVPQSSYKKKPSELYRELCTTIIVCITDRSQHLSYTRGSLGRLAPRVCVFTSACCSARGRVRAGRGRVSCLCSASARLPRYSLLTAGSLARECDRRKLFTPPECRKFGRAEWGTLSDYPKLASCAHVPTCNASLWKNPRLTRAAKKRRTQNEKRRLERRPSRALVMQPILHTATRRLRPPPPAAPPYSQVLCT